MIFWNFEGHCASYLWATSNFGMGLVSVKKYMQYRSALWGDYIWRHRFHVPLVTRLVSYCSQPFCVICRVWHVHTDSFLDKQTSCVRWSAIVGSFSVMWRFSWNETESEMTSFQLLILQFWLQSLHVTWKTNAKSCSIPLWKRSRFWREIHAFPLAVSVTAMDMRRWTTSGRWVRRIPSRATTPWVRATPSRGDAALADITLWRQTSGEWRHTTLWPQTSGKWRHKTLWRQKFRLVMSYFRLVTSHNSLTSNFRWVMS